MFVTRDDGAAAETLACSGSRSPLVVRLTDCASARSLLAASAVLVATAKAPAIKQARSGIAIAAFGREQKEVGSMRSNPRGAEIRFHLGLPYSLEMGGD